MSIIKLGDEILEFVENYKLLGIILNKKMSWPRETITLLIFTAPQKMWLNGITASVNHDRQGPAYCWG